MNDAVEPAESLTRPALPPTLFSVCGTPTRWATAIRTVIARTGGTGVWREWVLEDWVSRGVVGIRDIGKLGHRHLIKLVRACMQRGQERLHIPLPLL